jgi:predicted RNase H-like nuclease (RuvC/YqgF family)
MMLLLAQIDAPPIDGVSGWVIGLAVSSILASASAVWSEYQRRSERKDKKEQEKTVAEISTAQKRAELEYQSVKDTIANQSVEIISQREEIREMKKEYILVLDELRKEREHSRQLQQENNQLTVKVSTLENRIEQLEREVKSLERSRDDARAACKMSEETSPRS